MSVRLITSDHEYQYVSSIQVPFLSCASCISWLKTPHPLLEGAVSERVCDIAARDGRYQPILREAQLAGPRGGEHGPDDEAPAEPGRETVRRDTLHLGDGAAMAKRAGLAQAGETVWQ